MPVVSKELEKFTAPIDILKFLIKLSKIKLYKYVYKEKWLWKKARLKN